MTFPFTKIRHWWDKVKCQMLRCLVLECHEQPLRLPTLTTPEWHKKKKKPRQPRWRLLPVREEGSKASTSLQHLDFLFFPCGESGEMVINQRCEGSETPVWRLRASLWVWGIRVCLHVHVPVVGQGQGLLRRRRRRLGGLWWCTRKRKERTILLFQSIFFKKTVDGSTYQSRNVNAITKRIKMNPTAVTA